MTAQTASDERIILNALGDFARIVDRKQWQRLGEVFAEDIAFNYGDGAEQQGIAALRVQFTKYLDRCGPSQHLLGSIQFEFDGSEAVTRAYVQARHMGLGEKSGASIDSNGEYVDRWQRRAEGWRIVRRDARWDMLVGDSTILFG